MEVSLKQLAAILHLSERRVRQLRDEQGILAPEPGTGSNSKAKKYRLEKCVPEYIDFKITGAAEGGNTVVREKEQAEHEWIKKKISEIKLRRLKRELHESKDIEEFLSEMLVSFRARLITIPQKLAPLVIAEPVINKVRDMIESEIFEAIEELSGYDPLKIDKVGSVAVADFDDDEEEEEEPDPDEDEDD
jgi:hypothetical protein